MRDFTLICQIWSAQGGYQLRTRDSAGGAMMFDFDAGHLTIFELDGVDDVVSRQAVQNVYTRNTWQTLAVTFIEDSLKISIDGRIRYEDTLLSSPGAGSISFVTSRGDFLHIDDCLFTQAATSSTAGATFAFALQEEVFDRDFRLLRNDLADDFNDAFGTKDWWHDGMEASGDFSINNASNNHQYFLRMTHDGRPTFRLFRDVIGVEIFGEGQDNQNYRDSTDFYVAVDVKMVSEGSAWLGVRTETTLTGSALRGYFLEMRRNGDGTTDLLVRYQGTSEQTTFFEGPIPGMDDAELPEWVNLTVISYEDQIAFFADGHFLVALDNTPLLGGTLALGVEDGATADFDTLVIRDTTPHGE